MSHKYGDVEAQLDEDNALIASDNEDETLQSSSSIQDRCEGEGITLGYDSSDT